MGCLIGSQSTKFGWSCLDVLDAIHKCLQLAAAAGVAQLAQRLGFDLPDAFARHLEALANLLQSVFRSVLQPKPQAEGICGWRQGRLNKTSQTSWIANQSGTPHLSKDMWGFLLASMWFTATAGVMPSAIINPMQAPSQGKPCGPRKDDFDVSPMRTLLRRFFPIYCVLAALVTFGYAIYDGYQIDGDAVAYMDLGDLLRAHHWAGIVNGYWHPMYPAFLSLGHTLFRANPATELRTYYFVNFGIFLLGMVAVVCFTDAIARLREGAASQRAGYLLDRYALRYLGLALLVVASQRELSLGKVRPDALLQAFLLLAIAALLRHLASNRLRYVALMGVSLGCAYLTKSFAFVFAFLCTCAGGLPLVLSAACSQANYSRGAGCLDMLRDCGRALHCRTVDPERPFRLRRLRLAELCMVCGWHGEDASAADPDRAVRLLRGPSEASGERVAAHAADPELRHDALRNLPRLVRYIVLERADQAAL